MENLGYAGVTADEAAYYIRNPRPIRFCRNGRTHLMMGAVWNGMDNNVLIVYTTDEKTGTDGYFTMGVEEKRSHKMIAMTRTIHDSY